MTPEKLKPIPKYLIEKIQRIDKKQYPKQDGQTRFYSYITKIGKELAKVTVAVRNYRKQWLCKQVALHDLHDEHCYVKDMVFYRMSGYVVDWHPEIPSKREYYQNHDWGWAFRDDFDPWSSLVNIEKIGDFPQYKYSGYQYLGTDRVIKFLRQYEKYPVVEFLMKFGYSNFWDSKMLCSKATKDKAFRRWLIANKDVVGIDTFYVISLLNAYKNNRDVREQENLERAKKYLSSRDYVDLRKAYRGEHEKLLQYIDKQKTCIGSFRDYYNACVHLGLDMTIPRNRYPHDFKYWHDMRIDQYRSKLAEEDEKRRKALYDQFFAVITKYLPLERVKNEDYVVIIAQSPRDLVAEGEALHHCVGRMNYDQRVAREQSLIFFVRKADDISTPLVTMEYSLQTHKVLQLYGSHDSTPSEDVVRFVRRKWLPYANKQIRQIAA